MQAQPRIVDLFCGCGGFSLGAHAASLPPCLAIDIDPILTSSFATNHRQTRLALADLSKTFGSDIEREAGGPIFGVFGGPPCQAFSDIGHRKADDPRRMLLGDFFRLVSELRPAFFLMENVPGLGYADARHVLDDALSLLPARYALIGPLILDAADFGASTRRPRLFVIGYDPDRMNDVAAHDIDGLKQPAATVREGIGDLASARMIGEGDGFDVWKISQLGRPTRYASQLRSAHGVFTGHRRTLHTPAVVARFAGLAPGGVDPVGRHRRLDWNAQCPTLRAGTGSDRGSYQAVRPIHPDEPRVITVREAARLQGFPDKFRFHPSIWHSFRMIGNGVSPIISAAIFSLIAKRIELRPHLIAAAE